MARSHIVGFPRIGANRETKKAVEAYWNGKISVEELFAEGRRVEEEAWRMQSDAGLDFITVGDFSWYDHVLDTSAMLGVIPERFVSESPIDLDTVFLMARGGRAQDTETDVPACEMTKWFDTNYHYIVPEFTEEQGFQLSTDFLFQAIDRAKAQGRPIKAVLLGPLTYLWLGKVKSLNYDKLNLVDALLPAYQQILDKISIRDVEWIQVDEPILSLDLPEAWKRAFAEAYHRLDFGGSKCLLATYFGSVADKLDVLEQIPVGGVHIDACSAPEQARLVAERIAPDKVVSVGLVNGRNVWRADLESSLELMRSLEQEYGDSIWVSSSCSLLHVPVDVEGETELDPEIKLWLSFAKQKLAEVAALQQALKAENQWVKEMLSESRRALESRNVSQQIHNPEVQERLTQVGDDLTQRQSSYSVRCEAQRKLLQLPLLPTTTIGSFPQTSDIRKLRRDYKSGVVTEEVYQEKMRQEIFDVIARQESMGLDVLVHGEPERNDMVEYFGELLDGFAFTRHGWVQSYGSRCVKPPIIYGDISRPRSMTVEWLTYSQSLTKYPVKGMLTGPVTILSWSFVRDDQPLRDTALQIALALRDEVLDLEAAGINIIQIDEPAFREALPLRRRHQQEYLDWAVFVFRLSSRGVKDSTQIHTHMCYCEFNEVMEAIAALDADVITLESSRSDMELLQAFDEFSCPHGIGPGVYDIHSPCVPSKQEIENQLRRALRYIPVEQLWVNPDCGLKTRNWPEVTKSLHHMVAAAQELRKELELTVEEDDEASLAFKP